MRQARAPERALTVTLPGGLVLDDRCLVEAELRPLSGREEDWLASHRGQPSARIVTRVLEACLLRLGGTEVTTDLVRRLLVGDREFLMLQLRALTLGPTVQGVLPCPACAARMDVAFDITDVPVERRPQTAATYTIRLGSRGVRVRLLNGADQEAVLDRPANAAVAGLR